MAQGRTTDNLPVKSVDTVPPKIIGLKTVDITVNKPPFTLRHDTLEFDASAIKLAANANVLQLLKKLPGVAVAPDGTITVNGKSITKIKVDGRDFFGDNNEAATKYLSADMIDKVEVTATKDLASMRSLAVKAPTEDASINLVLRKDKNTGIMGNVTAGAGSRDRYLADGMISSMQSPTRVSIMGAAKNVTGEMGGAVVAAGTSMMGGGEGGLSDDRSGSISLNTKSGKRLTLDANYNYNNSRNSRTEEINRLNLLPDSSFRNQNGNEVVSRNEQHQLYTNIVYEKDSLTTWSFRSNAGIGKNSRATQTSSLSETATSHLLNTLSSWNNGEGYTYNGGSSINFNKTSRNRKLNLNTTWDFNTGSKREREYNTSINNFYTDNTISQRDSIHQYIHSVENSFNNNFTFNLSADVGHGFVVALDYSLSSTYVNQLREVFDYNPVSGKYGERDSALSNSSKNSSLTHTPSVQLAWKSERISIAVNTGMRIMQQKNILPWLDSTISIHQQQFAPNLQLNYSIGKYGRLYTNYSISSSAPSAEQLSPVVNNTNPLFLKVGNPFLKGTFTQNISANYSVYQPVKGFSLNLGANGAASRNEIVADQFYDSSGRQTSTFQNVNGTWRMMVYGSINLQRKKNNWTFNNGLTINVDRNSNAGFIARQKNVANAWKAGGGFYCSISYKEWLSISPSVNINVNKTTYSLPGIEGVTYNTQQFSLQWQLMPFKRLELSGDLLYNYNSQITVPDQRRYFVCNGAVAYSLGKKEQWKLKCQVNDIFNNNTSITSATTATYVETKQVNALRQYGMISVQFFFGKMGAR